MPFPTDPLNVTIEFAFGADLRADPATWVWTDVTADWKPDRDLSATIGRADATGKAQPARLSFWLGNPGGHYTKGNPLGTHWPYIRKNTPCRVTLDPGTGSVRQYTMYATQWIPRWGSSGDSGRQPLVQVVCNGIRRRLSKGQSPLRSPLYRHLITTDPLVYWPLEDGVDSTQAASGIPGGTPMVVDTGIMDFVAGGPAGSAGAAQPAIDAANALSGAVVGGSATAWQVSVWAQGLEDDPAASAGYFVPLEIRTESGSIFRLILQGVADQAAAIAYYTSEDQEAPADFIDVARPGGAIQGDWHLLQAAFTRSGSNTAVSFWFDGTLVGAATWAITAGRPVRVSSIGRFSGPQDEVSGNMRELAVAHISLHNTATLVDQYQAGLGWVGEPAADRIARLCGEEGVPVAVPPPIAAEDFEDATLSVTIAGTWARTSTQAHSGTWSYKSATIGHSASTDATVTVPAGATSMTVWYRVSSESGFDWFRILRDGVLESQHSGEVAWTSRTISVAGISQVTFRYTKDGSSIAGADAAWIDDITFAGPSTARMGPQRPGQFVALLDECQDADGGILLDGLSPGWTYLPRVAAYNLPVSMTIDMAGGEFKAPFEPLDDDQGLVNDMTVDRVNGSSAHYVDEDGPAGTAAIERYDDSATLNVERDEDLPGQASWRTHLGTAGGDALRFPGVAWDLHTAAGAALIEPWLTGGVRTRAQVTHPPSEYGPGPIDLLIEGYTETVRSRRVWTVAANTSPYEPWLVAVVGQGRVDSANSTVRATVAAGASSVQVDVGTVLWTTNPAKLPAGGLDLNIDGIRVRVTAITGAASPQTLTVDPATVVKPLVAGRPVRIWQPAVVAL